MKLLYGTTNKAKLDAMRKNLENLKNDIVGLRETGEPIVTVNESGLTPLENAKIKANAYFAAYRMPVFSCDSGLYFDGIDKRMQPGVCVRRVNGREMTDEEMIAYYASLARSNGGRLIGRYRNAIHLILDESTQFSSMDPTLWSKPFYLVSEPHEKRILGFPLDSLTVDVETGKYHYDCGETAGSDTAVNGFLEFFVRALRGTIRNEFK